MIAIHLLNTTASQEESNIVDPHAHIPLQEEGGERRKKIKIGDIVRVEQTKILL